MHHIRGRSLKILLTVANNSLSQNNSINTPGPRQLKRQVNTTPQNSLFRYPGENILSGRRIGFKISQTALCSREIAVSARKTRHLPNDSRKYIALGETMGSLPRIVTVSQCCALSVPRELLLLLLLPRDARICMSQMCISPARARAPRS